MVVAFTVCSSNYLPQALTLAESVAHHAPHWRFIIGLVDHTASLFPTLIPNSVEIIEVGSIGIPNLDAMARSYNIIELCTAVKPSFFKAIFSRNHQVEQIHYLDPDTCLFSKPDALEKAVSENSITLTPHHLTPIPLDGDFPAENLALNHGIYNLGYLGLRRTHISFKMLDWWEALLSKNCRIDLINGWFVDQLPMNYVPLYFDDVDVIRHPGVNMAFWNLHERRIIGDRQVEFEGSTYPLILFHFSGFSPIKPKSITRLDVRLNEVDNPGLKPLLADYAEALLSKDWATMHRRISAYQIEYTKDCAIKYQRRRNLLRRIARRVRSFLK